MRQIFGSGPGGKLSGRKAQVLVLFLIITLSTVLVLEGLDLLRRPVGRGRSGKVLIATAMGDRLLIIAPHPDDEDLAAGGLIEQAEAEGRKVEVVIMTSGDGNTARTELPGRDTSSKTQQSGLTPLLRFGVILRCGGVSCRAASPP